ncbi:Nav3: Neuron navigator 3 [Crotalus adamanteus]|uniref:Nav3: Neuron navigator 3 n=1 Tax=Crotalus adamanteus TaxID=8729 RepID=A0AAW1BTA1_CROAD
MMNGTANVNAAGRSHYASSIPIPRAASHSKIHTLAASPKLPPKQNCVGAFSSPRISSPRTGKAQASSTCGAPKGSKQKLAVKAAAAANPRPEKTDIPGSHGETEEMDSSLGSGLVSGYTNPWSLPKANSRTTKIVKKAVIQTNEKVKNISKQGESNSSLVAVKVLGKPSTIAEPAKTAHLPGKSPSYLNLYNETLMSKPSDGSATKRPQSCPAKGPSASESNWKENGTSKQEDNPQTISLDTSSLNKGPVLHTAPISFSSLPQHNHPIMATVAPFHYRWQGEKEKSSLPQKEETCDVQQPSPPEGPELTLRGMTLNLGFGCKGRDLRPANY